MWKEEQIHSNIHVTVSPVILELNSQISSCPEREVWPQRNNEVEFSVKIKSTSNPGHLTLDPGNQVIRPSTEMFTSTAR